MVPAPVNAGVDATETTGTGGPLSYSAWVALAIAIAAGGALGLWARFFGGWWPRYFRPLGDLGSPWVLTAFAVGAVSATARPHRRTIPLAALSGAAALVFATFVYYGTKDQDSGVFSGASFAAGWMVIGAMAAVAGALWWRNRTHLLGLVAVVFLSAVVAGEALSNLRFDVRFKGFAFHGGPADAIESNRVHLAVMTFAALLPLVLLPRWRAALIGVFAAAVLTWPASEVLRVVIPVLNSIVN